MAVAVGCKALQPGIDDQVSVGIQRPESVDVREVILLGNTLGTPVPFGRLLIVLGAARRKDRVIHGPGRGDIIFQEAGGDTAVYVRHVAIGVENRAPVRPIARLVGDVPFQFKQAIVVDCLHNQVAAEDSESEQRYQSQHKTGPAAARQSKRLWCGTRPARIVGTIPKPKHLVPTSLYGSVSVSKRCL